MVPNSYRGIEPLRVLYRTLSRECSSGNTCYADVCWTPHVVSAFSSANCQNNRSHRDRRVAYTAVSEQPVLARWHPTAIRRRNLHY